VFRIESKKCSYLALVALAAGFAANAAQTPSSSPPAVPVPTEPPPSKQLPLASQQAVGGFWRTDYSFKASIRITNSLAIAPLSVTPVLYMADGTEYVLPSVQVPPTSVVTVAINDALASAPAAVIPHLSTYGSAVLRYTWRWQSAVSASIVSLDVPRSLTFTSRFVAPSKSSETTQSHTVEGLWWLPFAGSGGFVTLVNTGGSPIEASLQTYDPSGQPLNIASTVVASRATAFVDLRDLLGKSPGVKHGGVRVTFSGLSEALVVNGGIEDDNKGFSAALPFEASMAGMPKAAPLTLAHAGLMLGQQDPMMGYPKNTVFKPYAFARNVSNKAVTVTPALNYPSGAQVQSSQLPILIIQPNQTVPLVPAAGFAASNADHGYVNLVLKTDALPGSLLTVAGSVDQTGSYVFEIEPQAVSASEVKQLPYWNTAGANDTMINLWNPLSVPQDLVVSFFAGRSRYRYPVHLEPGGSAMLSVKEIQQTARPDMNGHALPSSATEGSAWLAGASGDDESITVVVSAGTFNILSATCGTTCPNCTGYTRCWIAPNPLAVGYGSDYQAALYAQLENGTVMNKTSVSAWSSSLPSIASVAGPGLYAGVAIGSFYASASATLLSSDHSDCLNGHPCPTDSYQDSSPGTVTPVINSISPSTVGIGRTSVTMIISGKGFGSAPSVSITGGASNVSIKAGGSDTSLTVTFATTGATAGTANVTVTSGGQASNPAQLSIVCATPINFAQQGQSSCIGGTLKFLYGWASPTGSNADLATCQIEETVSYGTWPSPPFPSIDPYSNPTIVQGSATNAVFTDTQSPPSGSFIPPYSTTGPTFTGTQTYEYNCSCSNTTDWTAFAGFDGSGSV
jgi:hypothetical protein